MRKNIKHILSEKIKNNLETHNKLLNSYRIISDIIYIITKNLKLGAKIMLCGNGGSAADAQHLAAEFLVRLRPNINRNPIAAISLAQDTSTTTALSNDYNFK